MEISAENGGSGAVNRLAMMEAMKAMISGGK